MTETFEFCILLEEKPDRPFDHITADPDYCLHVHIAGDHAQPGVGDAESSLILEDSSNEDIRGTFSKIWG